jgi:hypothetical protein
MGSDAEIFTIVADEFRKNDRALTNGAGQIIGSMERYVLSVLPKDISATIRAIALTELKEQVSINNPPSNILVDGMPMQRHGIDRAQRRVRIRFQDTANLIKAVDEIYKLLQQVVRIQQPAKNSIVARKNFYLWLNGVNLGLMPQALAKISYPGVLTQDSVVRVVGPLVPYARKLFWNPVGASAKMEFYRTKSKRSGVRFLPKRGASAFAPRFRPYAPRTLRRKANATDSPAASLASMLSGATPPGRIENVGQIVKRIISRNPQFRGLHFTDGWVEYPPAAGWSKLRDPRVPAFGVMFSKKGALNMDKKVIL